MRKSRLVNSLLWASIASNATAHFVLQLPTSLGFNDTLETMSPCDSFDPTNRDTVTFWPTGGYPVLVLTTHEDVIWDYNFALVSDLIFKPFTPSLHQLGVGTFCEPQMPGLAEWIGQDVVFQAIQHAPDGELYQCAAVTFIDGPAFPIDGLGCMNTTGITATWLGSSPTSSTVISSTSTTSPTLSSTLSSSTSASSSSISSLSSSVSTLTSTTSSMTSMTGSQTSSGTLGTTMASSQASLTTSKTATGSGKLSYPTGSVTATSKLETGSTASTSCPPESGSSTPSSPASTNLPQSGVVTTTITVTEAGSTVTEPESTFTSTATVFIDGSCSSTALPVSNLVPSTSLASSGSSVSSTTTLPTQVLTNGADSLKISIFGLAGAMVAMGVF